MLKDQICQSSILKTLWDFQDREDLYRREMSCMVGDCDVATGWQGKDGARRHSVTGARCGLRFLPRCHW